MYTYPKLLVQRNPKWYWGMCAITICAGCYYQASRPVPFNAKQEYARITGMQPPESAEVVSAARRGGTAADELLATGPGVADGGSEIILKVDAEGVGDVISGKPPFGKIWHHARLPDVLLRRVELLKSLSGKVVYFSIRERCCSATDPKYPYWNGDVIIVDPATAQIVVASWDM